MAPGRKALRRFQFGYETTAGLAVAATNVWRGPAVLITDEREVIEVEEHVGIVGGTDRTHIPNLDAKLSLGETPVTYEQLQHLLRNALGGPTTGVADGAGSGKIYTTTIPTTSSPTDYPWTCFGGDDHAVERTIHSKVTKITLTGAPGKALTVSADLFAHSADRWAGGFQSGLTIPAVEDVLFGLGQLLIDPVSGGYGETAVAKQFYGFKLTIETHWRPLPTGDQFLAYSQVSYAGHTITGEVTWLHDTAVSGASGEKVALRAQTPRRLQMRFNGSTLTSAGTAYSKKTLIINLPIKWKTFGPLADSEDVNIVTGQFFSRYNATVGDAGNIIVVNEVASLAAA